MESLECSICTLPQKSLTDKLYRSFFYNNVYNYHQELLNIEDHCHTHYPQKSVKDDLESLSLVFCKAML